MNDDNVFVKRFLNKRKSDLEYYIDNPSSFDPSAVEAAKIILADKIFKSNVEEMSIDKYTAIKEPVFVEKAIFKSKLLYRFLIILTSIYTLIILVGAINYYNDYVYIWLFIYSSSFFVLISKSKKTLIYLKLLAIMSLMTLSYQYIEYFVLYFDGYNSVLSSSLYRDFKIILICLITIFTIDRLVEIKLVEKK